MRFPASTNRRSELRTAGLRLAAEKTTVRKTILGHDSQSATSSSNEWFDVEAIAGIGVTSEADDAPVENVLYPDREVGWRAGEPGPQIIRITFGGPTNIR